MRVGTCLAIVVLASTCSVACKKSTSPDRITVDAARVTAPSLELSVFIASDGFHVKSLGGNLAPGCASPGQGVTVPNKDGAYDYAGLTACAVTLKGTPAGAGTTVTIAATPTTQYQTLVSTMDAIRNSEGKELFPEILFGLARAETAASSGSPPAAPAPARPHPPAQPAPQPTVTNFAAQEGVAVLVSKTKLIVDDEIVAPVPSDAELGVDARYKRSGRGDFYIVPLANALDKWRERDRQVRAATGKDPSFSEAIIIADGSTPYRLFSEVLFTLGQSEFGKFHLMVLQGAK